MAAAKKSTPDLSFEEAFGKLEAIVEALENGDVPLAEMVSNYEEGTRYLKICQTRLHTAELKIQQLKSDDTGPGLVSFDEGAPPT